MNSSFDTHGQFCWDSTSLTLASTCWRKYYYKLIEGWSPDSGSAHLRFGGHYATALEHYYKHIAAGLSPEDALIEVVHEALIETWEHERDTAGNRLEETGHPWESLHNLKTRGNLIRTIIWYFDHFAEDPTSVIQLANGKPGVEYTFKLPVDENIIFSGHIDRLVTYSDNPYVMDQKAQPNTTKVLTPSGWKQIGDLKLGEFLYGKDGNPTELLGLYPKGITPVYRVTFNDGSFVDCGEDHIWTVADQFNQNFRPLELKTLLTAKPYVKFFVPLCAPVQHPTADLPLHPYVLGVLLGDGYFGGNSIQLSTSHNWLAEKVAEHLAGDAIKKSPSDNYVWTISGGKTLAAIRALGLKDKLSTDKFVPEQYIIASEAQRRELLAGLLVTDGSWNGKSRIYDSTSLHLTKAICALVRSLGGTARYRDRRDGCYRTSIRLPELPTGVGRRYIDNIVRIADAETTCVKVAAPDHLYLTENYTVTHNTTGFTISQRFFGEFDLSIQMSMYTFAGKVIYNMPVKGVIIDGAQIAVGFTRFERGITLRTEEQLNEWYSEMMAVVAEGRARYTQWQDSGDALRAFPRNLTACSNYGGCEFKEICSKGQQFRDQFLRGSFTKGEPWSPMNNR